MNALYELRAYDNASYQYFDCFFFKVKKIRKIKKFKKYNMTY